MQTPFSYNIRLLILLLLAAGSVQASSELPGDLFSSTKLTDVEITGRIDSVFTVSPGLAINLVNQFGNVEISTWDQQKVEVHVRIRARDKDEDDAYKILNGIEVELIKTGNTIRMSTETAQNRSNVGKMISKANPFNKSSVDIDYTLIVPRDTRFDIENKFGDVSFQDLTSKLDLELAHGDLRADLVNPGSRLALSFSKVDIEEANEAVIILRDSRMDLKRASSLDLDARSSEIRIDEVSELKIESKRDEVYLREVGSLNGNTQFSKIEAVLITKECDLELSFGSLDIEQVSEEFVSLRIDQRNVDVQLNIKSLNFDMQASLEGGLFVVPPDLQNLNVEKQDEKKNIRTIEGHIGMPSSQRIILKGDGGEYVLFR